MYGAHLFRDDFRVLIMAVFIAIISERHMLPTPFRKNRMDGIAMTKDSSTTGSRSNPREMMQHRRTGASIQAT
jgi:hypothetical protein